MLLYFILFFDSQKIY